MIYILEVLSYYEDTWKLTFYFVTALSLLLGLLWTYYQVIIKGEKKKQPLKENIIYNNSNDIIENYDIEPKKKDKEELINNYVIKNNDINNYIEENNDIKSKDNNINNNEFDTYTEEKNEYKEVTEDTKNKNNYNNKHNSNRNNNKKKNNYNRNNYYKKNNSNYKNSEKRTSN